MFYEHSVLFTNTTISLPIQIMPTYSTIFLQEFLYLETRKKKQMDLNLTEEQKKAMASVLIDIMNADDNIHVEEVKYLKQLQEALGISEEGIEECLHLSVVNSMRIIRGLDHLQKQAFSFMMTEMIKADGEVDSREADVLTVVCLGADIPIPAEDSQE